MIAALLAGAALSWAALPSARLARSEVAAARIGSSIYVVGASGRTSAAVERYDIRRRRWRLVRRMPIALNHPTAVAYRGDLYVHGGYAAVAGLSDTSAALLRYDPERNRWRRLRSSPTPRAAHAVAVMGHRLYAAGGAHETGSLSSLGPAYVPLVQDEDAPLYPSNRLYVS